MCSSLRHLWVIIPVKVLLGMALQFIKIVGRRDFNWTDKLSAQILSIRIYLTRYHFACLLLFLQSVWYIIYLLACLTTFSLVILEICINNVLYFTNSIMCMHTCLRVCGHAHIRLCVHFYAYRSSKRRTFYIVIITIIIPLKSHF